MRNVAMKVLVTGAAGFIGSHLCDALLASGHQVAGVDNFDPYYERKIKERNIQAASSSRSFSFMEGDLRDAAFTRSLVGQEFDAVAHLAGRGGVRRSIEEPRAYAELNYLATLNVLEALREVGPKKLVFASTSSVYGSRNVVPFREDDPSSRPLSPYAATKLACEALCHAYHHLYGLDIWALRFFTVYGPRQRPDMAIHKFVKSIETGEPIERFGDGSAQRDYTYVSDIVTGVERALERAEGYEIINIGGAQTTPLGQLISLIEELLGKRAAIIEKPMQPGDVPRTAANVTKAMRLLDFSPSVPLEGGLRAFIDWYRKERCQ